MARKRKQAAGKVAESLGNAVQALQDRKFKNPSQAAKAFGVYRSLLMKQLQNGTTRQEVRESQQILSNAEETVLRKWCSHLTAGGYSAGKMVLKEMAEALLA